MTERRHAYIVARRYPAGGAVAVRAVDVDRLPTDVFADSVRNVHATNMRSALAWYRAAEPRRKARCP